MEITVAFNNIIAIANNVSSCSGEDYGHVHKYETVLWALEKLRKTIFCYKMINFSLWQQVIQAVSEIGSRFWVHKNWHPNSDELAKKIKKPQFVITVSIHLTVTSEQMFYLFICR